MQYLGVDGLPRGFRALFSGKTLYLPEKISSLEDDILIQASFSERLLRILSPYFDRDLRLERAVVSVSAPQGKLNEISSKFAVWQPLAHHSDLPLRLIGSLLEEFSPELLEASLFYCASSTAEAAAFCDAFPIEKKTICLPPNMPAPKREARFVTSDEQNPKAFFFLSENLWASTSLRLDAFHLFRTFGYMAQIIDSIFRAADQKFWFYGDDIILALPADNMELITAGFYLIQAGLPIRKIQAISSKHRVAHSFLSTGSYNTSAVPMTSGFHASLRRFLYEIAKGSLVKKAGWMENLKQKGSFLVDSGSQGIMNQKIEAHFAGQNLLQEALTEPLSKDMQAAYTLSQENVLVTIGIQEETLDLLEEGSPVEVLPSKEIIQIFSAQ
ncbi:MAG: hypothetical protein ACRCY4_09900 [Brevinema sp.]